MVPASTEIVTTPPAPLADRFLNALELANVRLPSDERLAQETGLERLGHGARILWTVWPFIARSAGPERVAVMLAGAPRPWA